MTKLAKYCVQEGRRIGLLVNDIGDLGIDALILNGVEGPNAAVDHLAGACACCSDSVELRDVIAAMAMQERDLLLFETTGVADAADMLDQLRTPEIAQVVQTPRLITVADVTRYPDPLADYSLMQHQVKLADMVILSKTDLVPEENIEAARAAIRKLNTRASILDRDLSDVEMATLFGIDAQHESTLAELLVNGPPGHDLPQTLTVALPQRMDRARFEAFLHALPPAIVRAKGFVALDEDPPLHLFQYVEPELVNLTPWTFARSRGLVVTEAPADPHGVFIGSTIDEAAIRAGLAGCVAE
jgi:G3E family GTPase